VDTGDFGKLRLLVSDVATTRRILMQHHMPARVDDVVAAEIEDRPGALSEVLKPLKDANVNVVHMYAHIRASADRAVMIFRFGDIQKAVEILQANGVKLLDADAFGMLENQTD
jgi:hypothetical protein